jgi:hypothetical protein
MSCTVFPEASDREGRGTVSRAEFLRDRSEGGDEPGIAGPELPADHGAHRMDERSGGALGACRMVLGMVTPDGRSPGGAVVE